MSSLDSCTILKLMEIDHNHIDSFVMETEEGTKRTKEKFYHEAAENRNSYVNKQQNLFDQYLGSVRNEITRRYSKLMPVDKTSEYERDLEEVGKLLFFIKLNSDISDTFKTDLDFIISSIKEETSLEELNSCIQRFLDAFKEMGSSLTLDDFKYTMFTEKYMSSFLENSDSNHMHDVFDKIFFMCPDIKLQLKMNLMFITQKYAKELAEYVSTRKLKLFQENGITENDLVSRYTSLRFDIGNKIAMDEYYNTQLFLSGKKKIADFVENAPARVKNYDMFAITGIYASLDEEEKNSYNSAMMGLYVTLNELKKYYHYEFMIKDLVEKYKGKDSAKTSYLNKKKEIEKEEKNRQGIYKEYLKANGIGFLAKKSDDKINQSMLKMNEQVRKLDSLYQELQDLEISYQLSSISESASIYDLFIASLKSFSYLEKSFSSDDFSEKTLEENINDLFRFLYNPNNAFLREINIFADYNVTDIVADKYKLLKLNVTSDMISAETIDSTMESVSFINLIQNIERSNTSIHRIDIICRMHEIIGETPDDSAI